MEGLQSNGLAPAPFGLVMLEAIATPHAGRGHRPGRLARNRLPPDHGIPAVGRIGSDAVTASRRDLSPCSPRTAGACFTADPMEYEHLAVCAAVANGSEAPSGASRAVELTVTFEHPVADTLVHLYLLLGYLLLGQDFGVGTVMASILPADNHYRGSRSVSGTWLSSTSRPEACRKAQSA
jgi:hypothetical protein